jgi:hypothetical protein
MKSRAFIRWVLCVTFGLVGYANATAFNQLAPPTCPVPANFAWNYRVGGGTGVFDLPSDPNCTSGCPQYINKLNHSGGWWPTAGRRTSTH